MILILRGHIRNAFQNDMLYKFVQTLSYTYDLKIYIHTWDIKQSSLSWRKLKEDNTSVTVETINEYFKNLTNKIKHIIIDNENNVELIGNVDGYINNGPCPIKAWKYYWYGKFRIIDLVRKNEKDTSETIINTRFDIFNNSNKMRDSVLYNFLRKYMSYKFTANVFVYETPKYGIDNFYIGNIDTMYCLIQKFHFNLDYLLKKLPNTINQEKLVFYLNDAIFNKAIRI